MSLWAKLSTDIIGDPKLMSAAREGAKNLDVTPWLIAFAKLANAGGRLEIRGKRADSRDIAALLPGISAARVEKCRQELREIDVLTVDSDGVDRFVKWETRSGDKRYPSDAPELTRERQRRSREHRKPVTGAVTTPPVTSVTRRELELEEEIEQERRVETLSSETARAPEPEPPAAAPQPEPQQQQPAEAKPVSASNALPWPPEAIAWGSRFYPRGAAPDRRRADVHTQITGVLNGGCAFRGEVIRATPERLDAKCAEMIAEDMRSPLKDRDKAIVVLLTKLGDLSDDSPTERAAAQARDEFSDDSALITAWLSEHPDDAKKIREKMQKMLKGSIPSVIDSCIAGEVRKRIHGLPDLLPHAPTTTGGP